MQTTHLARRRSVIRVAIVLSQLFLLNSCAHVAAAPTPIVIPPAVCSDDAVGPEPSTEDVDAFVRRMVGSTVEITVMRTEGATIKQYGGTGVVIGEKSILTARHVIRDAVAIVVQAQTIDPAGKVTRGLPIVVKAVKESAATDSAVLEPVINGTKLPPAVPIERCWKPAKGSGVWAFGKKSRWAWGYVNVPLTAVAETSTSVLWVMRLAISCDFGDSGGPVVTPRGEVVGLMTNLEPHDPAGGYAVPIANIMKDLGITQNAP